MDGPFPALGLNDSVPALAVPASAVPAVDTAYEEQKAVLKRRIEKFEKDGPPEEQEIKPGFAGFDPLRNKRKTSALEVSASAVPAVPEPPTEAELEWAAFKKACPYLVSSFPTTYRRAWGNWQADRELGSARTIDHKFRADVAKMFKEYPRY